MCVLSMATLRVKLTGHQIDSYKRASVPRGYYGHLPAFSYSGTGTPDAPPTLAYVVVGPRIRGRFDAQRAKELGIPNGPMRSKLIKGETITFKRKIHKIEDGIVREIEVERTVRPEECIGESDTPAVRAYTSDHFLKTKRIIGCPDSRRPFARIHSVSPVFI